MLRCLKGTVDYGLFLRPSSPPHLQGYSDVNWSSNVDNRHSVGGYYVFWGDNLVSWSSKMQNVVLQSSTKSNYHALEYYAIELTWLQSLLKELRCQCSLAPIIWCDNVSARHLVTNPIFHVMTKHIKIDVHFGRDKVL